eukprot:407187-Prorocentrum_minimum.AAC.1
MDQSDAGSVGIFSRWINQTQDMWEEQGLVEGVDRQLQQIVKGYEQLEEQLEAQIAEEERTLREREEAGEMATLEDLLDDIELKEGTLSLGKRAEIPANQP